MVNGGFLSQIIATRTTIKEKIGTTEVGSRSDFNCDILGVGLQFEGECRFAMSCGIFMDDTFCGSLVDFLHCQTNGFVFIGSQQKQCSPMKPWMITVNWYRKDA